MRKFAFPIANITISQYRANPSSNHKNILGSGQRKSVVRCSPVYVAYMMRRPFHNCQEKIVGFLFSFFLSLFLCFLVLINVVYFTQKLPNFSLFNKKPFMFRLSF